MRWTSLLLFLYVHYTEIACVWDANDLAKIKNTVDSRNGDCYKAGALEALAFLNKTGGNDKTDRAKLTTFLQTKGFDTEPGSLYFIDAQDKFVTLNCGDSGGKWTVESEDKEYNKIFGKEDEDRFPTLPSHHISFRKYICTKKNCKHTVYAFARPAPVVKNVQTDKEAPFSFHEKDKIQVECTINPCIYDSKHKKCKVKVKEGPVLGHPHKFEWVFATSGPEKYDIYDSKRKPYEISPTATPDADIPLKIKLKVETLKGSFTVKTATGSVTVSDPPIGTMLTIASAEEHHDGKYECLVTNDHGIESTPEKGQGGLHIEVRYKGVAHVHVRLLKWTYMALGLCIGLIVLALLMNFACPTCKDRGDKSSAMKTPKASPEAKPAEKMAAET